MIINDVLLFLHPIILKILTKFWKRLFYEEKKIENLILKHLLQSILIIFELIIFIY